MQLKTILNRVQKHQSFVYTDIQLKEGKQLKLDITIRPRSNSRPICSGCGRKSPGYDTLPVRRFEFIPFWGILVYFVYAMRRVNCPDCGIKVERVPWADGKRTVTNTYAWFLGRWAKQLSWSQTAKAFRTSWYTVYSSVEMAVQWGRDHVDLGGITAIGIDELCWGRWHRYVTVVYQINRDRIRLLWVGEKRTAKTLLRFFRWLGKPRTKQLEYVCEPMKKVAFMLRRHKELIVNWFRAKKQFSSGIVEGLNAKAKVTTRKAYGFKCFKTIELALYHNLGALPQPIVTHKFF